MIGITLDSNSYISALIFGGKPLRILEMGLDGRAEFIITGDQHLLHLGKFGGVWIVRASEYLQYADEEPGIPR